MNAEITIDELRASYQDGAITFQEFESMSAFLRLSEEKTSDVVLVRRKEQKRDLRGRE